MSYKWNSLDSSIDAQMDGSATVRSLQGRGAIVNVANGHVEIHSFRGAAATAGAGVIVGFISMPVTQEIVGGSFGSWPTSKAAGIGIIGGAAVGIAASLVTAQVARAGGDARAITPQVVGGTTVAAGITGAVVGARGISSGGAWGRVTGATMGAVLGAAAGLFGGVALSAATVGIDMVTVERPIED